MLDATGQTISFTIQNAVAIGTNASVALGNAIVLGDPTNANITVGIGGITPVPT